MNKVGSIHVIIGCMFSGKTTELIRNAKRYKSIGKKVLVLNYKMDTRYGDNKIISHDLINEPAYMISSFDEIFQNEHLKKLYNESEFICINEGQFFKNLKEFCINGANDDNKIIYVCGLDGDYKQEKFGDMIDLIPVCDSVKKLYALCKICGEKASFTRRIISKDNDQQVLIGSSESYLPVCRKHLQD